MPEKEEAKIRIIADDYEELPSDVVRKTRVVEIPMFTQADKERLEAAIRKIEYIAGADERTPLLLSEILSEVREGPRLREIVNRMDRITSMQAEAEEKASTRLFDIRSALAEETSRMREVAEKIESMAAAENRSVPMLADVRDSLESLLTTIRSNEERIVSFLGRAVDSIERINSSIESVNSRLDAVADMSSEVGQKLGDAENYTKQSVEDVRNAVKESENMINSSIADMDVSLRALSADVSIMEERITLLAEEKYADALSGIQSSVDDLGKSLELHDIRLNEINESFSGISSRFSEINNAVESMERIGSQNIEIVGGMKAAESMIDEMSARISQLSEQVLQQSSEISRIRTGVEKIESISLDISRIEQKVSEYISSTNESIDDVNIKINDSTGEIKGMVNELRDAASNVIESINGINSRIDHEAGETRKTMDEMKTNAGGIADSISAITGRMDEVTELRNDVKEMRDFVSDDISNIRSYVSAMGGRMDEVTELRNDVSTLKNEINYSISNVGESVSAISSGMDEIRGMRNEMRDSKDEMRADVGSIRESVSAIDGKIEASVRQMGNDIKADVVTSIGRKLETLDISSQIPEPFMERLDARINKLNTRLDSMNSQLSDSLMAIKKDVWSVLQKEVPAKNPVADMKKLLRYRIPRAYSGRRNEAKAILKQLEDLLIDMSIFAALGKKKLDFTEIYRKVPTSKNRLRVHLGKLQRDKMIKKERVNKKVLYSLAR